MRCSGLLDSVEFGYFSRGGVFRVSYIYTVCFGFVGYFVLNFEIVEFIVGSVLFVICFVFNINI